MSSRSAASAWTAFALLVAIGASAPVAAHAAARPTFRVLSAQRLAGSFLDVDGLLSNTFVRPDGSAGNYEAPVRLMYAADRSSCGTIGLEDLANGFIFNFPGLHDDYWNIHFARRMLGDAFILHRRLFYASPTWDKKAIERMGRGHMQRRQDATPLISDVAAWLRDPSSVRMAGLPSGMRGPACRASTLVGYGYSDSASLLRTYVRDGLAGDLFDAGIVHGAGATCWDFTYGQALASCPDLPMHLGAKIMSIDSETDMDIQNGAQARQDGLAEYRRYEIAGEAHLPKPQTDLMEFAREAYDEDPALAVAIRATSHYQVPETMGPPTRAFFDDLVSWTRRGTTPPPNAYLEGSFDPTGTFTIARDADGNALGGVRLPYLTTNLPDGRVVGAAIGSHSGTDVTGGFILGGRYDCFDDLVERYPIHRLYVERVTAGARYAATQRWILSSDRDRYVAEAKRLDLSTPSCPPWPGEPQRTRAGQPPPR